MGKKKQTSGLGRQIIKDRFGNKNRNVGDSFLHTSDLKDGYDWGRLNLQSVTEQNNLEEFLSTAEMAGTEFTAEKLNVKFVTSDNYGGIPQGEDLKKIHGLHKQHQKLLRIPRRPPWKKEMSTSQLDQNEKEAFLEWRRGLSRLQEVDGLVMTPYEKNLDFWRQLWRVIERSDVVVQIVDARNPLLFYCPDLEQYVHEVDENKVCLLLINKADFLTPRQRDLWAKHFTKKGVRIAFWSALEEANRQEQLSKESSENLDKNDYLGDNKDGDNNDDNNSDDSDGDNDDMNDDDFVDKYGQKISMPKCEAHTKENETLCESQNSNSDSKKSFDNQTESAHETMDTESCDKVIDDGGYNRGNMAENVDDQGKTGENSESENMDCKCETESASGNSKQTLEHTELASNSKGSHCDVKNSSKLCIGEELLDLFRSLHPGPKVQTGITTIGMVGYPNVGKSSTINAILRMKKVPVSATPGRTKHFQTLFVDPELMLCDCPGLVFPSFVTTKADLVVSGILPVDQMRDHIPPTSLVCQLIPHPVLEQTYGIILPAPGEGEDPNRPPTAHELLNAYGAMRGYMTQRGVPDCPRSSRYILKDYVNGKLLYCHPPPDVDPMTFNPVNHDLDPGAGGDGSQLQASNQEPLFPVPSKVDKDFFRPVETTVHSRTARSTSMEGASNGSSTGSQGSLAGKPWKRHNNRHKKEKLRRVYGYLDD